MVNISVVLEYTPKNKEHKVNYSYQDVQNSAQVLKTFTIILSIIQGGKRDIHIHTETSYENYYLRSDLKIDFCKIIHG